jgi:hypothetical protein
LTAVAKHRSGDEMAKRREERNLIEDDAECCAHEVAHHNPAMPRTQSLVPTNGAAADAGVRALSAELQALPASIRNALANAESNAGHISEDRLQGLAELIQNADDLGATSAEFTVDETGSRLMFRTTGPAHPSRRVALAIPWLSLKSTILTSWAGSHWLEDTPCAPDVLEVHQGHFRVRYEAHDLTVATSDARWPGAEPSDALTTFVIPLEPAVATTEIVTTWLSRWSDAGLVFLANLSTVTLLGPAGNELAKLHVERAAPERVETSGTEMTRRVVTASDAWEWVVYSRSVPVPKGWHERAKLRRSAHRRTAFSPWTGRRTYPCRPSVRPSACPSDCWPSSIL